MIVKIIKSTDDYEAGEIFEAGKEIWNTPKDCWRSATAEDLAEFFRNQSSYDESMESIAKEFCDMADVDFDSYDDPWSPLEAASEKLGVEIY